MMRLVRLPLHPTPDLLKGRVFPLLAVEAVALVIPHGFHVQVMPQGER